MNSATSWQTVNQRLIAKSISELSFEELLIPEHCVEVEPRKYHVNLQSGVTYRFDAQKSIWGHVLVKAPSIQRVVHATVADASCAAQFFIDAQAETGMTDIILGNFLEEMHSTLYSDLHMIEKYRSLRADEVASWDGNRVQCILNGHPKILLNKGRMGWSAQDLEKFAPENHPSVQLRWIAVEKNQLITDASADTDAEVVLHQSLTQLDIERFTQHLAERTKSPSAFRIIPVHPWQWDHVIQIQFAGPLARGEIIDLGVGGDLYQPQISLRTLSNVTRPKMADVKLSLSILNTSAFRGIPSRYIANAPSVSKKVANICEADAVLRERGTCVLQDIAGSSYEHPAYLQVPGSPYRYRETLGALCRESVASKIADNEVGIITASLFYRDEEGSSLIGAYIKRSGLPINAWLERYFDVIIIPLYHLQLKYGLGLVAHGQNIVLRLKNFVPTGMFLKDFQGDLRLADDVPHEAAFGLQHLDRLPRAHLIHDLITGHFSTVLRFISGTLMQCDNFPEVDFYRLLTRQIENYLCENWDNHAPSHSDILRPALERVLVNKVRFNAGYADSAERLLVTLGKELRNPLFQGDYHDYV